MLRCNLSALSQLRHRMAIKLLAELQILFSSYPVPILLIEELEKN